ncbi:hypothetical protein COY26_02920 [Candidatus Woesearchaeota archaeon CG_4_10_14_0_2_um_filter_33_10]|nr:MAG: hypothetical protein AUJ83_03555 [Candidatus Woesearchaeota archaeon CG1_02_33_12]PIN79077.1 MAG: hypothetical protein COV14_01050 [Candidatus Woesearchaeota archaeon CG10_big_fil_rev_8_21_14_0_10_33_12]PIU72675.1 MAG: hypothetical protein COS79_01660 [Candidatus Woesearchaeota archaeon CG06_land_8_20_14_3_00_33_13]PIZ53037.1 MAG: hypothetical protein COY26_02920 [Candidatus Woesearchaeota archaeon CG_4_10_14_0_2_um_filter_33_10]
MTYLNNQINLFKKSFKLDKKRFFSVIIFDFLFILVSYIALFLCGMWLNSSASKISGLDLTTLTENAINELAALKSFYYGAIICLILLIIFLFFAWSFFQGFIWNTILKKKFNLDYFKKFLLLNLACIPLSIIPFFIALICLRLFNSIILFFSTAGLNTSLVMFVLLILSAFIFLPIMLYLINFISILYFYFTKKSKILDSFKDTFKIAVKKIHLLYIPCLVMSLAFVFLAVITIPLNILPLWLISLVSFVLLVIYAAWARFYIVAVIAKL